MNFNWITNGTTTPFYTRKEISISKPVHKAIAKVCGLGQFVFSINDHKVGDHELDPGWTDYRKIAEYVTFDVSELLSAGKNVLGGEIGNGWYIMDQAEGYSFHFPPFMPPNPNPYQPFGDYLIFGLVLEIEYEDQSIETIITDSSWKVCKHEVLHSNIYGSEIIDNSYIQEHYTSKDYNDTLWKNAKECNVNINCIEQFQPPVKVIHQYKGIYLSALNHRRIYDFTQNMAGILEFDIKGKKGSKVVIYPAEKLKDNGDVDQVAKGWNIIDTKIQYTIGKDDKWEHFRQKFTYFAGKVIAFECEDNIEIKNIYGNAITSAYQQSGTFICDNEKYNKIYHIIEKSVEANMVSVHTDCPTIERFAWQEPNHLMGAAIMFMKNGNSLWRKFFMDMRLTQHTKDDYFYDFEHHKYYIGDGLIPSQAPCFIPNVLPAPGIGSFYDIIPWGSSIILGVRWHYLFYGDLSVVRENFDAGLKYFRYLQTKVNDEGFINHGLGDWGNPKNECARENVETAFLYADAITLAYFASLLKKDTLSEELTQYANDLKDHYNKKLLIQDDHEKYFYYNYENKNEKKPTQSCEALPLYWGMVPEEHIEDVVEAFKHCLDEDQSFSAGEVGLPYIIQMARKYDMNDTIASYITKDKHPSYYAFILDGLTTLGEYWENNPRSHAHDMMGHIIEWYYNGIAGIEILEPGFKEISIHPYMPQDMNHFTCTYLTPYGKITIKGDRNGNKVDYSYDIPDGITVRS